jgi:hypothetical protein
MLLAKSAKGDKEILGNILKSNDALRCVQLS